MHYCVEGTTLTVFEGEVEVFIATPRILIILHRQVVDQNEGASADCQSQVQISLLRVDLFEIFGGNLGCHVVHHHGGSPKNEDAVRH